LACASQSRNRMFQGALAVNLAAAFSDTSKSSRLRHPAHPQFGRRTSALATVQQPALLPGCSVVCCYHPFPFDNHPLADQPPGALPKVFQCAVKYREVLVTKEISPLNFRPKPRYEIEVVARDATLSNADCRVGGQM
jgi:hypothetical protein